MTAALAGDGTTRDAVIGVQIASVWRTRRPTAVVVSCTIDACVWCFSERHTSSHAASVLDRTWDEELGGGEGSLPALVAHPVRTTASHDEESNK